MGGESWQTPSSEQAGDGGGPGMGCQFLIVAVSQFIGTGLLKPVVVGLTVAVEFMEVTTPAGSGS